MKTPTIKVYPDARGGWRWRLRAANGRIVADSGEAYSGRREAMRAAQALGALAGAAVVTAQR